MVKEGAELTSPLTIVRMIVLAALLCPMVSFWLSTGEGMMMETFSWRPSWLDQIWKWRDVSGRIIIEMISIIIPPSQILFHPFSIIIPPFAKAE